VRLVGKMTLNRNPDNYFAETEQVAFHTGHVVTGIDFTNDPLLQGRLFSYIDTQLRRVGPNFAELPINRPLDPVHNNQRDGMAQTVINKGRVSYFPNRLGGGCPMQSSEAADAFVSHAEKVDGAKRSVGTRRIESAGLPILSTGERKPGNRNVTATKRQHERLHRSVPETGRRMPSASCHGAECRLQIL
jgi:catalase